MTIDLQTHIEDLVAAHPAAVTFLMERGIRCLRCGEPIWGTLDDAMAEKNIPPKERLALLDALRTALHSS